MVDEAAFRQTRGEINRLPCVFERALLARLDLLRSATTSIDVQTYIFDEDDAGRLEFKRRLEAEGEIRGLEASWTRKDGSRVSLPAAIICRMRDGKIARLDEYLDSAHVALFRQTF